MVEMVGDFLRIIGVDVVPPETLAELIPYLLQIGLGCFLVSVVFRVIGSVVGVFVGFRRW